MLDMMTFTQLRELQLYLISKQEEREDGRRRLEEAKLEHFFERILAKQAQQGGQSG
jgi:hypothetical protein